MIVVQQETLKELSEIRERKQNELFDTQRQKSVLISNIISFQKQIDIEFKGKGDE